MTMIPELWNLSEEVRDDLDHPLEILGILRGKRQTHEHRWRETGGREGGGGREEGGETNGKDKEYMNFVMFGVQSAHHTKKISSDRLHLLEIGMQAK